MELFGEIGVAVAVFAETFLPPIPSEAVLPVAGYLAYEGRIDPWLATAWATVGSLVGAWVWWVWGAARPAPHAGAGRAGAADARHRLDRAEAYFDERVHRRPRRTVHPAGAQLRVDPRRIAHMPFWRFTLYTLIGSLVWNGLWIGLGYGLGPAMEPLLARFSGVLSDVVVVRSGWPCLVRRTPGAPASSAPVSTTFRSPF